MQHVSDKIHLTINNQGFLMGEQRQTATILNILGELSNLLLGLATITHIPASLIPPLFTPGKLQCQPKWYNF